MLVPMRFNSSIFYSIIYLVDIMIDGRKNSYLSKTSNYLGMGGMGNCIKYIHCTYELSNAQRSWHLIGHFSYFLIKCNSLFMDVPHDEELLDVQSQLWYIIK